MKYIILIGILYYIIIECSSQNAPNYDGYIFTSPRTLNLGSNNELNLKRFGDLDGGTLLVQVFYKKNYNSNETQLGEKEFEIIKGNKDIIFNFPLDKNDKRVSRGRIQINGTFGSKQISGSDSVTFASPKSSILIIQTDNPMYQPGQTVKFRVVRTNKNLKTYKKNNIADIEVLDPAGTKLFQFKNEDLTKGIIEKEFSISKEPLPGKWTIKVESDGVSEKVDFVVKKYAPAYEVNIKFPSFVLVTEKFIPITICANSTYGEPVIGSLNLTTSLDSYHDKQPAVKKSVQINGCYNFKLNVSDIEKEDPYSYRRIKVSANVLEKGTGVQKTKTEYLRRHTSPLALQFIDSLDFFKPGLPYYGKLKVSNPDNTPASDEPFEICATLKKKRVIAQWWATKTLQVCKNYTSDQSGIIKFILIPQNTDVISVKLNAISLKYKTKSGGSSDERNVLLQPQTSNYLIPFYSPSGSFIQIQPVQEPIPCQSKVTVKLLYTARKGSDVKFYYQVSKQSSSVLADSFTASFSSSNEVSNIYVNKNNLFDGKLVQLDPPIDSDEIKEDKNYPEAAESHYLPPLGEAKFDIEVNSTLSSEVHVLVFYVRDDKEVVADSMKIKVEDCFPNKIFQTLTELDTNTYFERNPCYGDKIQPGLDDAAFKSIKRPPFIGSSSNQDSLTAFQTSGFAVISDLFIVNRPCNNNFDGPDEDYDSSISYILDK